MKNFCLIDIGTNAVKTKIFSDEKYFTPRNKFISKINNSVSKDDIINNVFEFGNEAQKNYSVKLNNIYIYATKGLRSAPNSREIISLLETKTGSKNH